MTSLAIPFREDYASPDPRGFDGVVCFGGVDWWYHNRGHYDVQMMRRMSRSVPVLYINSLGMRFPRVSEGAMFGRRVVRKLRSIFRGLREVERDMWVSSVCAAPGITGGTLNAHVIAAQVRLAMMRVGIRRPLVWTACPSALPVVDLVGPIGRVFQRTDLFESFDHVNGHELARAIGRARAQSDLTLYCSRSLLSSESRTTNYGEYVDHGVDLEAFLAADRKRIEPQDIAACPRPRVGFVGGLDFHTFDVELFRSVTQALPDVHFVLVGGNTIPRDELVRKNVTMLGRKPLEQIPAYMAACDVLIMPWNRSEWIRNCNPVKLKEYLAVGRPIVSTPFPELASYHGLVRIARDPECFADCIRRSLREPHDPRPGRVRVSGHGWEHKLGAVINALGVCDIVPDR